MEKKNTKITLAIVLLVIILKFCSSTSMGVGGGMGIDVVVTDNPEEDANNETIHEDNSDEEKESEKKFYELTSYGKDKKLESKNNSAENISLNVAQEKNKLSQYLIINLIATFVLTISLMALLTYSKKIKSEKNS